MGTFLPFRAYNTDNQLIIHSKYEDIEILEGLSEIGNYTFIIVQT